MRGAGAGWRNQGWACHPAASACSPPPGHKTLITHCQDAAHTQPAQALQGRPLPAAAHTSRRRQHQMLPQWFTAADAAQLLMVRCAGRQSCTLQLTPTPYMRADSTLSIQLNPGHCTLGHQPASSQLQPLPPLLLPLLLRWLLQGRLQYTASAPCCHRWSAAGSPAPAPRSLLRPPRLLRLPQLLRCSSGVPCAPAPTLGHPLLVAGGPLPPSVAPAAKAASAQATSPAAPSFASLLLCGLHRQLLGGEGFLPTQALPPPLSAACLTPAGAAACAPPLEGCGPAPQAAS
jgi:hypothetical protein